MEAQRSRVRENFEELAVRFRDLNIGTPGERDEAVQALLRLQEDLSLIEQATSVVETSRVQDRVASSISKVEQLRAHVEEEATP
jgi:hypothetical protein